MHDCSKAICHVITVYDLDKFFEWVAVLSYPAGQMRSHSWRSRLLRAPMVAGSTSRGILTIFYNKLPPPIRSVEYSGLCRVIAITV